VDRQLETLIDLQGCDSRIARLEAEAPRLHKQIETIQTAVEQARKSVDALKAKVEATRKDLRSKEKDLEVIAGKRSKQEGRLYEVKTNKEYSAVLLEIEEIKQEKAQTEEEILALMELGERLAADFREGETQLRTREEQGRRDEAAVRERLAALEAELAVIRGERDTRARDLPPNVLSEYDKILKAKGGLAIAPVSNAAFCGGCRVGIRPQAIQELRKATGLTICENCGRYLYWQESA
jgi:predicted  nucleic acid-binding Zn-ribbon protein